MTDTTSPNVQLVKAAYAAFGRGDINAVVEAMHPEIEWHEAEHSPWHAPGGHHGPTAVLGNVFARIPELFDHFTVDPQAVHDAGATVIVEGRYRAKAAAPTSHSTPRSAKCGRSATARSQNSANTPTRGSFALSRARRSCS